MGWSLLLFSRRWAVLGARAKSREMLRASLLAVAVEDLSAGDARDDLVTLAIPLRCVEVAGLDPNVVFKDVAARSGPAIAAMLRDYLERPRKDVLGSMGFRQVDTERGVGFRDASDPIEDNAA